jgi:hypothetical protein
MECLALSLLSHHFRFSIVLDMESVHKMLLSYPSSVTCMQGEPLQTSDDIIQLFSMIVNMLCTRLPEKYYLL